MRRINLLPPEERRRPAAGLTGVVPATLLIVGAVAIIAMVGFYLFFLLRLNGVEDEIAELDQQIAEQNQRLAELAPYRELQARLDAKKPVADGIFRTRFPWDEFLQGLAFIIPETTALDGFSAEAAPIDIQAPVEQPLEPPGDIDFTGISQPRYQNVADFVVQMSNLRYLSDTRLTQAELDRTDFAPMEAIYFEVNSELITVVGENGTEVRTDEGTLDEVTRSSGVEDRYQARVGPPRIGRR
jgi:type IV pilus assembly protein PilN